ncbi:hypothetical protein [Flavobacterium sp.]|uniref:hypothetical protein n=1 Tax=Flavobacterium sp. TaxID=239 RepID=UPI00375331AD
MIKNSTYIRTFTPLQRKQLQLVEQQEKLKTVPDILFYALDKFLDQQKEIERLKRIIEYKNKQIQSLNEKINASF